MTRGSFATSASEIAGLAYDPSSGEKYVRHNPGDVNSLEISTLRSNLVPGKLDTLALFLTRDGVPLLLLVVVGLKRSRAA